MTDNVIPFGKKPVVPGAEPPALAVDDNLTEHQIEMHKSIINLAEFLIANKDRVQYFVVAVSLDDGPDSTDFCTLTSGIDPEDYAMALQLLQRTFNRLLDGQLS
jgi:hypothetical protein